MCQVLEVSRAGYYAWAGRGPSARAQEDVRLLEEIREVHGKSRKCYGAPRVHAELRDDRGKRVGRRRVARLMSENSLSGRCGRLPGPKTTRRERESEPPLPDLVGHDFTGIAQFWWTSDRLGCIAVPGSV